MNVAAIIVTRGDHEREVEERILSSLPEEWEVLVWDNGAKAVYKYPPPNAYWNAHDLSVYGRYAAIEYTDAELIYVQDDDCVVSNPQAIVDAWIAARDNYGGGWPRHPTVPRTNHVTCNMPQEFRHEFYEEHALVGFGACFHRDAPQRAWDRFQYANYGLTFPLTSPIEVSWFHRTCDIVFTALTPRVLVDVPHENLPWAFHHDRMYRQGEHLAERVRMLDLVRELR